MTWVLVFIGGGAGSMMRFLLAKTHNDVNMGSLVLPIGTFIANILSCFILGILMSKSNSGLLSENSKLILATGFCGGFSTFSTFGYEIYLYLQKGQLLLGISYVALSLIIGVISLIIGTKIN